MPSRSSHTDRQRSELLTPDDVAAILRVTPRTVRRWGAIGTLERIRLGGRITRYTSESVAQLIAPEHDASPAGKPSSGHDEADDGGQSARYRA
jgi:hypothetical protein